MHLAREKKGEGQEGGLVRGGVEELWEEEKVLNTKLLKTLNSVILNLNLKNFGQVWLQDQSMNSDMMDGSYLNESVESAEKVLRLQQPLLCLVVRPWLPFLEPDKATQGLGLVLLRSMAPALLHSCLQPHLHLSSIALLMSHFQRGVGGQLGNLPLRQELNASYKEYSKSDQKNIHSPLL